MDIVKKNIDGLFVINPEIIKDGRGYFVEAYNKKNINKFVDNVSFVQDNESESSYGVLRGLHFQHPPYTQAKLVRCLKAEY